MKNFTRARLATFNSLHRLKDQNHWAQWPKFSSCSAMNKRPGTSFQNQSCSWFLITYILVIIWIDKLSFYWTTSASIRILFRVFKSRGIFRIEPIHLTYLSTSDLRVLYNASWARGTSSYDEYIRGWCEVDDNDSWRLRSLR
jgi:hypothetical protein